MAPEKRLVDALNAERPSCPETQYDVGYNNGLTMAVAIVRKLDAVEVVRCRDCANSYESSGSFTGMRCKKWGCYDTDCECRPDDFCSYGERRE